MTPRLNEIVNEVLVQWSAQFIIDLSGWSDAIPKASGEGSRSFDHQVVKATETTVAKALFSFAPYLRLADMRRLNWSELPNVDQLEQWIKDKGFQPKASKTKSKKLPSLSRSLIRSIAWAIAKKKLKTQKRKRIRWYNRPKEQEVGKLYRQLLDDVGQQLITSLKSNNER